MRIQIRKQHDGSGLLRCLRADGTTSWQKQPRHGAHFALHDLTHYSVETSLGYRNAFFGLVEAGWEIDDTTGKGSRGPLPPEALEVERLVGIFDMERAASVRWTADEFNAYAPRPLTEAELQRIRQRRGELFARWRDVPPGETLELVYPAAAVAGDDPSFTTNT